MRLLLQAIVVLMAITAVLPSRASYDSMPAPPPVNNQDQTQPDAEKAKVKRGTHWYRKPQMETAAGQMRLADAFLKAQRLRKAANAYQALVYAWPDSPEAPVAQLKLAQVQEQRGALIKAFDEYQYLFDYYPGLFDYRDVLGRQFKIANVLMTTRKGAFLFFPGFEAPERAIPMYEKIIRNGPTWEYAATAQLNIGIIHEMNEEFEEAVAAFEIVQNRYRDEALLADASFRGATSLCRIYRDRRHDENACDAARAALLQFIRSYPANAKVQEARTLLKQLDDDQAERTFERARYYDEIARRPKAALIAYESFLEKYSFHELAAKARARIEILRKEVNSHEKK